MDSSRKLRRSTNVTCTSAPFDCDFSLPCFQLGQRTPQGDGISRSSLFRLIVSERLVVTRNKSVQIRSERADRVVRVRAIRHRGFLENQRNRRVS